MHIRVVVDQTWAPSRIGSGRSRLALRGSLQFHLLLYILFGGPAIQHLRKVACFPCRNVVEKLSEEFARKQRNHGTGIGRTKVACCCAPVHVGSSRRRKKPRAPARHQATILEPGPFGSIGPVESASGPILAQPLEIPNDVSGVWSTY